MAAIHPRTLWLGAAVWLLVSAAGLAAMSAYANRPGEAAHAPVRWPGDSELVPSRAMPTVVMIAHPKCDCTRASLAELREFVGRAPNRARTYVVFMEPRSFAEQWDDTDLWKSARAIPGVIPIRDLDGREAERFGALTSGQTFLYDSDGQLRFAGGATVARGHEGDNAGLEAMLALVTGKAPQTSASPVFGCPLFDQHRGSTTE